MTNDLHTRILEILDEKGLSDEQVSKDAGLDRGYIKKTLSRPDSSPRIATLRKLARAMDVPLERLTVTTGVLEMSQSQGGEARQQMKQLFVEPVTTVQDIPLMGTAAGSHLRGAFIISNRPVDFVRRPPAMQSTVGLYALFVEGTSMVPQYSPGELVYVNPHKPARAGDPVIVQTQNGEGADIEASIGIYVKTTAQHVVISKHNPSAEIQIARKTVLHVHKVLTVNELFGV